MFECLLRPKEACKALGASYTTLRRWIKEGKIRAIQAIAGKYRIPESEVKRLLSGIETRGEQRLLSMPV